MSEHQNALLNEILIRTHRGLLGYVGECWPWDGTEQVSPEQAAVNAMLLTRRAQLGQLVDLLDERGWTTVFGSYPTEFTDLHYLSLNYLLGQLVADEMALAGELESAATQSGGDPEGMTLLYDIAAAARENALRLQTLHAPATMISRT